MPAAAVAAIGTAWSIYSGTQQEKAAQAAQDQAQSNYQDEKAFAQQRFNQWYKTFFPVAQQRIKELQSQSLLPEDAIALGKMQEGFGRQQRALDTKANANLLPSGVANGAYQDLALRQAEGTSTLSLQDQAQKNQQLGQWYQMGLSEPTSSYLVQGANRDMAQYQDMQAQRFGAGANSDWNSVAKGMMSIADSMAQYNQQGQQAPGTTMQPMTPVPQTTRVDLPPLQYPQQPTATPNLGTISTPGSSNAGAGGLGAIQAVS